MRLYIRCTFIVWQWIYWALVAGLRRTGGDVTSIEVKAAGGGLPESLAPTLSALANLPGGGTVILGLDERTGFRPVHLSDPQALKQGLAAKARGLVPPVRLEIEDGTVDGSPVVVAQVSECDRSAKPCRVASTGKSYIRGYDGDFMLSAVEEQAFLAARKPPMFDRLPVEDATENDLDTALVESFAASIRRNDRKAEAASRTAASAPAQRGAALRREADRSRHPRARNLPAAVVPPVRHRGGSRAAAGHATRSPRAQPAHHRRADRGRWTGRWIGHGVPSTPPSSPRPMAASMTVRLPVGRIS